MFPAAIGTFWQQFTFHNLPLKVKLTSKFGGIVTPLSGKLFLVDCFTALLDFLAQAAFTLERDFQAFQFYHRCCCLDGQLAVSQGHRVGLGIRFRFIGYNVDSV